MSVDVKVVMVDGKPHFCTVLPPNPHPHDGLGWGQNIRSEAAPKYSYYKGLDDLAEYATTKADQHA